MNVLWLPVSAFCMHHACVEPPVNIFGKSTANSGCLAMVRVGMTTNNSRDSQISFPLSSFVYVAIG